MEAPRRIVETADSEGDEMDEALASGQPVESEEPSEVDETEEMDEDKRVLEELTEDLNRTIQNSYLLRAVSEAKLLKHSCGEANPPRSTSPSKE